MNIIVTEINFLEIEPEDCLDFDFILSDQSNISVKLTTAHRFLENKKSFSKNFKEKFGTVRYDEFCRKLILAEIIKFSHDDNIIHRELAATAVNNVEVKNLADKIYSSYQYDLQIKAVSLSTAIWLIKDSCVQSTLSYTILDNSYSSAASSDMYYTLANGSHKSSVIRKDEIKRLKDYYELVYPLINKHIGNKEIEMTHIGPNFASLENSKIDRSGFSSYTRALVFLQEARNSGLLASKIDKYLQCLYAFSDGTRRIGRKLRNISANLLTDDSKEKKIITDNIAIAYKIRSRHTHGNKLNFSQREIEDISKKLDEYVRGILLKLLPNKELNYSDEETQIFVRDRMLEFNEGNFTNYFKRILKR